MTQARYVYTAGRSSLKSWNSDKTFTISSITMCVVSTPRSSNTSLSPSGTPLESTID